MRRGYEIEEEYIFLPPKADPPEEKPNSHEKEDLLGGVFATIFWGIVGLITFCMSGLSWWTIACGVLFLICFL